MHKIKNKKLKIEFWILIFITPVIIHFFYSLYVGDAFASKWNAGDILLYCATILAAIIAWFSVEKTYIKVQMLQTKPYLAYEILMYKDFDLIDYAQLQEKIFNEKASKLTEFSLRNISFIINDSRKNNCDAFCELNNDVLVNLNIKEVNSKKKYSYIALRIKNVGAGSIVNLKVALKKTNGDCIFDFFSNYKNTNIEENQDTYSIYDNSGNKFFQNLFMCNKDEILIRIIVENNNASLQGIYELFFIYDDICNIHYKQNFRVIVNDNNVVSIV